MRRWEYMAVELPHGRRREEAVAGELVHHVYQAEAILNKWGAEGWEVVGFAGDFEEGGLRGFFVLKRQRDGA